MVQVQSLTRQVEEGQAQAARLGADLQAAQAAFADAQAQLARLDADAIAHKARADQVHSWLHVWSSCCARFAVPLTQAECLSQGCEAGAQLAACPDELQQMLADA